MSGRVPGSPRLDTRLVVTSLVRHAGVAEPTGFVRIVDLAQERVLSVAAVPESVHRARDPNPRGGRRGAKGVSIWRDRLVVANVERLFVLGSDWRLVQEFTHPWLGGIHDVLCEAGGIWVTCADADLLVRVSWDGVIDSRWSWRDDAALVRELGFRSVPPFDPALDYRDPLTTHGGTWNLVHLNAVARADSRLVLSLGRILPARLLRRRALKGALVRLGARRGAASHAVAAAKRRRGRRIDRDELPVERIHGASSAIVEVADSPAASVVLRVPAHEGVPNHNVHVDRHAVVFNDSNRGSAVRCGRDGAEVRIRIPGEPPFPRGLAVLPDGRFVVGSQRPAALHVVDFAAREVIRSISLGGADNETVYGVAVLPDQFDDVPPTIRFAA